MTRFALHFKQIALIVVAYCCLIASSPAIEIPPALEKAVRENNHTDILDKLNKISEITPAQFLEEMFSHGTPKLLGVGFCGFVFKVGNSVYKISNIAFSQTGLVTIRESDKDKKTAEEWQKSPRFASLIANITRDQLTLLRGMDYEVAGGHAVREVIGGAVLSHYNPKIEVSDLVTTDGIAYRRTFAPGKPLVEFIQEDKRVNRLSSKMGGIWKLFAGNLKLNEQLIRDYGLSFDFANPSNALLVGSLNEPKEILLIDTELLGLDPSASEYYRSKNKPISSHNLDSVVKYKLPMVPEIPAIVGIWDLSLEQAVLLMHQIAGTSSRAEALHKLSQIPNYSFPFEGILTRKIVDAATAELANGSSEKKPLELKVSTQIFKNADLEPVVATGPGPFDNALAMNVQYGPVLALRPEIEKTIGRKLDFFKTWNKDGEAHVTVITPPEYDKIFKGILSMEEIGEIAKKHSIQKSIIKVEGIGSTKATIQENTEETYFILAHAPNLLKIRKAVHTAFVKKGGDPSAWDPTHFYPHITIGYTLRDLHETDGAVKDVAHSLDTRFQVKMVARGCRENLSDAD